MEGSVHPHIQRFLLRLLFLSSVLTWSFFSGNLAVIIVTIVFLAYAVAVLIFEHRRDIDSRESAGFVYADIVFVGLLTAFSGGWASEFHLFLYFIVALRAPYRSWYQALAIPAVCTAVYIVAGGVETVSAHWFEIAVRLGLLWFLPVLLRIVGLRSTREKERAERLSKELSRTHDEIRRYTAALEKANSENERRLADITLIHEFVMKMRHIHDYENVYGTVLESIHKASDAPWIVLVHTPGSGKGESVRTWGDPPSEISSHIRQEESFRTHVEEGIRTEMEIGDIGQVVFRTFICRRDEDSSIAIHTIYPPGHADLMDSQVEVVSALMDAVELEMELLRLEAGLTDANTELVESNRHLLRLHELQSELAHASLARGDINQTLGDLQSIMANELFELDRLNLFLPNRETQMLECRTSVGIEDYPLEEIKVPMDEDGGAISRSFREGRTIFFGGEGTVPNDLRLGHPYDRIPAIRSHIFVIVPLLDHQGRVLGVIGADRKYSHMPIPASTVTMLELFASHVALVLSLQESSGNTLHTDS